MSGEWGVFISLPVLLPFSRLPSFAGQLMPALIRCIDDDSATNISRT